MKIKKKLSFDEKVWQLMKTIPCGRVTTYKLLARKLNSKAYRAVGQACKRNTDAPRIPCHRVVNSSGKVGYYSAEGYSAEGGIKRKIELLTKEGIKIKKNKIIDFQKVLYKF